MAMIACPECGNGISDKAPACPHCGIPAGAAAAPTAPASGSGREAKRRSHWRTWLVFLVLCIGGLIYVNSSEYKKQFKPDMPVAVKFRPALTGPGLVLMVENTSNRHLAILGTLTNPSLNNTRNFRFDIAPKGRAEAGYREGWPVASGDQISLTHDDYKDWKGSIP